MGLSGTVDLPEGPRLTFGCIFGSVFSFFWRGL